MILTSNLANAGTLSGVGARGCLNLRVPKALGGHNLECGSPGSNKFGSFSMNGSTSVRFNYCRPNNDFGRYSPQSKHHLGAFSGADKDEASDRLYFPRQASVSHSGMQTVSDISDLCSSVD